ncbi:cortex morphogenetic protein CmpA [Insulibacter thermoxylanivorax]|uniref:cortex morphogenetic protein CmpA n=1 Tax=Insulibacter thermoxylanivorax TaxID=2749268 RepID=UPI0019110E24|nr:cortex morphogenetic protein CmpA [Insulibacter thermoxylanivorax]
MPQWLCNQLQRAFIMKDLRQIRVLNECWFFYRTGSDHTNSTTSPHLSLDERV